MPTFRPHRRVLSFDRCSAALYAIAHAGYAIDVITPPTAQQSAHESVFPLLSCLRPVPAALALEEMGQGAYCAVIASSLEQVQTAAQWDTPLFFAPQVMLGELAGTSGMARRRARQQIEPLLSGVQEVFLSASQRANWLSDGRVISPGAEVDHVIPYRGDDARIAWTGVDSNEAALREGRGVRDELLPDADVLHKIALGTGPATSWEGWLQAIVSLRALLYTPSTGHMPTYDFYALSAMAAGMPVVATEHGESPLLDGETGCVSNDYGYLRAQLNRLRNDEAWARSLGARARDWVAEYGRLRDRADQWSALLEGETMPQVEPLLPSVAPRVSLVMPLFNKAEYTEKCLYALAENTGDDPDYEVIIIDNASTDWTQYLLLAFEGDVDIVRNEENVGFARANNQGARRARGEYLLFLNNDTEPCSGWLEHMVRLADSDETIGIVGSKLLYPQNETVQHAGIEMMDGMPDHIYRGVPSDDPRVCSTRDLDMVTGACLLVRRTLFEALGGFDEAYLNGVEDVDLCLQARAEGYRVVYCAESVVYHHEGTSEGRFDHVRENLQRFFTKWQDQFDTQGQFIAGRSLAASLPDLSIGAMQRTLRGYWEGPFFVYSSLAHVNREMVSSLLGQDACDLGLIETEPDQYDGAADMRYAPLVARMGTELEGEVDFHVRHRWPPDVSVPSSGKLVLIQPWEYGRLLQSWVEPMQKSVDQIWAYTSYVRQVYIDSGFDPDKIKVVPLGVDVERFHPGVEAMELPTDKTYKFLFVGGTVQRKGIDLLLQAYRAAFTRSDDVALIVKDMGTQTFYRGQTAQEEIEALQRDAECAEIIYLDGDLPAEQMPALYAACDCLVHPYRGEGFGLPVAEAMACGLPVVVTKGGACDDFCSEENAFMVPAKRRPVQFPEPTVGQAWMLEANVELLAACMRRAVDDPELGRQMGRCGAERIARDFTWEQAAAVVQQTLRELCDKPSIRTDDSARTELGVIESSAEVRPEAAVVVLGGDGTPLLEEVAGVFEGQVAGFDVTLSGEVGLGDQLEVIRQRDLGAFLVVALTGARLTSQSVRLLVEHMRAQPDIAVAEPVVPEQGRGIGIEDVETMNGDLMVFRRDALDAIGGFDRAFFTVAVLDEAVRQLRRQGGRAVRVLDAVLSKRADEVVDSASAQRERGAIEALDRGDWLRGEGHREEAVAAYREAVENKGNFVEALIVLAAMLIEEERADEAVGVLEQLVHLDGQAHQSHNYLGMAKHRSGDRAGARASFERAYELKPEHVETLVNLSIFEWEEGNAEAAVGYLEKAAECEPDNRDVIVNTAVMQVHLGHVETGVQLLGDYVEANEADVEAVCMLADLCWQHGDAERAKSLAQRALVWRADYAPAKAILEKLGE